MKVCLLPTLSLVSVALGSQGVPAGFGVWDKVMSEEIMVRQEKSM